MPFNEYIKRILGLREGEPTCTRLTRSGRYQAAYAAWVRAQVYLNWTGLYFKSYHYQKAGLPSPLRVQLIREAHVRGVIFFYEPGISTHHFTYLFDLLKDRVQAHGYTLHSCDKLEVRHERYLEQVEKHVLTPLASDLSGTCLCNQLYGNILLDYLKVNNKSGYIRFVANVYNDTYFSRPLPFDDLLEKVLQPNEVRVR